MSIFRRLNRALRVSALTATILYGFCAPARAPEPRILNDVLDLHRTADLSTPVVLRLNAGERVWILSSQDGISRVRFRRGEAWHSGYAETDQLNADAPVAAGPAGDWQVGVDFAYSVLSQGARHFQTQDQVNWTTSSYASATAWPALFVQYRRENFWRFSIGIRRVDFQGHAVADVDRSNTRDIEVEQNMISARIERAWRIIEPAYLSVGAEVARALALTERIGGIQVPTTSEDIRVYAGGSFGVGASFTIIPRVSGFVEARAGVYPTLSPMAYVFEGAAGAGYWF